MKVLLKNLVATVSSAKQEDVGGVLVQNESSSTSNIYIKDCEKER